MILDPIEPIADPSEGQPPPEVRDMLYRIAKDWGCVCRPKVMEWSQDPLRNRLIAHLSHADGCHYTPLHVFEPPPEIDDEAIAARGDLIRKRRQRITRQSNKRRT